MIHKNGMENCIIMWKIKCDFENDMQNLKINSTFSCTSRECMYINTILEERQSFSA